MQLEAKELKQKLDVLNKALKGGTGDQDGCLRFGDRNIQACNGIIGISVPCETDCDFIVDSKVFAPLVASFKDVVEMTVTAAGKVRIKCPPHKSSLAQVALQSWHHIECNAPEMTGYTNNLTDLFALSLEVTQKNESRPQFSGVYIEGENILASDGLRVIWGSLVTSTGLDGVILPREFVEAVLAVGTISKVFFGQESARFVVENSKVGAVEISTRYVNAVFSRQWRSFFPQELSPEFVVVGLSDDVQAGLKRMSLYENDPFFTSCTFTITKGSLECYCKTSNAEAKEAVPLSEERSSDEPIVFNTWPSFLLWALKHGGGRLFIHRSPDLIYFSDTVGDVRIIVAQSPE